MLAFALNQVAAGSIARTGQQAAVNVVLMVVPIAIFIMSQSQILETMASSGIKDWLYIVCRENAYEKISKKNRTSIDVLFFLVTLSGLEPEFAPWEGAVLTARR